MKTKSQLSDFMKEEVSSNKASSLFNSKSANQWMEESKTKPIPKMLFDEFWNEGELCVLFADTNQGKSILAVQIAESIASGLAIDQFSIGVKAQKVLYFDFELSDKQFEARYSQELEGSDFYTNHYTFNPNFIRSEINSDCTPDSSLSYDDWLLQSIEKEAINNRVKVVIIDNITYLNSNLEKSKDAGPFLKKLLRLKVKSELSILVLAHTPKRDMTKPLTLNDISGSKAISNFIDSAFTIGESQTNKQIKYLKQIKVRHKEFKYHAANVVVCGINKPKNFLCLQPKYNDHEYEHLKVYQGQPSDDKAKAAHKLKDQGLNNVEIGKELNVSEGMVRKYLKKEIEEDDS
jgi:RecA-family ATPase